MIYTYYGILLSYEKEWDSVICHNVDESTDVMFSGYSVITSIWNLKKMK